MHTRISPLSVILVVVDSAMVVVGLLAATLLRSTIPLGVGGALPGEHTAVPAQIYGLAVVCWAIGLTTSGAYDPQRSLRWFNEGWRTLWGASLGTFLMAGLLYFTYRELSRLQFIYFYLIVVAAMLLYRAGLRASYRLVGRARPGSRTRILIIGAGELGQRVGKMLLDQSRWGFEPLGYLDDDPSKQNARFHGLAVLGGIGDMAGLMVDGRPDEVWIALPVRAHDRLEEILHELERQAVRIRVVPDYFSMALVRANAEIIDGLPIIGLRDPLIGGMPRLIKRLFDLVVASVLMVVLSPLMAVLALVIKLTSPGPSVIRQDRIGENGRVFKMFKFRTMVADADSKQEGVLRENHAGQIVHKVEDDPRVTPVGRILRRYSLDELPQFVNVLRGDMSLVGPRPEMPWLVERYETWQRKRFAVPQGLTGWWQINGRSDKPMHLHTEDDLYYVYNYSLWLDIQILARTPLAVLRGKGAF